MSEMETRALGRTALILLAASLVRLAVAGAGEERPPVGADVLPHLLAESRTGADDARARSRPLEAGERLDLNRASAAELDRLPGIGPATADAIVRSRETEGPFRRPEELDRVRGVGPALLARVSPHLHVHDAPTLPGARRRAAGSEAPGGPGARPLDLNRADTMALQALPGVGPALARRIVEARRTAPFRSVEELARVKGIGPATLARLRPLITVHP